MTNFKSLYDDLYNNGYHSNLGYTHSKPLIKIIYNTIPEGSRIIDVGCSNGTAGLILNKKYSCSGIDISEVAINLAKKNGFYDCKICPTHNIDYPNSYFDAILCTDVLEHVVSEEIIKTFQEFERITKNNSYYFLRIALKKEFHKGFVEIKKKHSIKNLHTLVRSKKQWEDFFEQNNLRTVKTINGKNKNFFEVVLAKK